MPASVKFSILGLDGIAMKIKAVKDDARYRGGRFALRKAAMVLAEEVRAGANSVDDKSTPRSIPANVAIRFNRRQFDATGRPGFRVGIMGGAGRSRNGRDLSSNPGGDTRYWRHLEFGTSRTRAQPFMRRALADNINLITNTFVREYQAALTRAIRRESKK